MCVILNIILVPATGRRFTAIVPTEVERPIKIMSTTSNNGIDNGIDTSTKHSPGSVLPLSESPRIPECQKGATRHLDTLRKL